MLESHIHYADNVIVSQRIIHFLALFTAFYKFCLPQNAQLMRYRRLIHAKQRANIANAQLALHKRGKNTRTSTVAKHLEKLRYIV